jgi:hypothetical protein
MLSKILNLCLLAIILNACATKSSNDITLDYPEFPIAGDKVANELEELCTNETCCHLNNWLNELYLFKAHYDIIR